MYNLKDSFRFRAGALVSHLCTVFWFVCVCWSVWPSSGNDAMVAARHWVRIFSWCRQFDLGVFSENGVHIRSNTHSERDQFQLIFDLFSPPVCVYVLIVELSRHLGVHVTYRWVIFDFDHESTQTQMVYYMHVWHMMRALIYCTLHRQSVVYRIRIIVHSAHDALCGQHLWCSYGRDHPIRSYTISGLNNWFGKKIYFRILIWRHTLLYEWHCSKSRQLKATILVVLKNSIV